MNYKQVRVNTGYAGNSISSVDIITDVETIEEAASLTQHEIQCSVRGDSEDDSTVERFIKEFYSGPITLALYTAVVPAGVDSITLVLSDGSPWYKVVNTDQHDWTYDKVQEWNEFIKSL